MTFIVIIIIIITNVTPNQLNLKSNNYEIEVKLNEVKNHLLMMMMMVMMR